MSSLTETYIKELAFLEEINGDRKRQYRSASWRKSPYDNDVWQCTFGKTSFNVDFHIKLEDGSLLTNARHRPLLDIFKSWMCLQTHFDATGGATLNPSTAYIKVTRVLRLIDYFLLNAAEFELTKYGLSLVTEGDLKRLIIDLGTSNSSNENIYHWNERLTRYLKDNSSHINSEKLETILSSESSLSIIDIDPNDRILVLTDEELIRARAYLWDKGFYTSTYNFDYRYSPNTAKIAEIIYSNTLWGKCKKDIPEELRISSIEHYFHEYPRAPIYTTQERYQSKKVIEMYRSTLRSLGLLREIDLPVPMNALDALSNKALFQALKLKSTGRFRTLPQNVVFQALRNALEFILEYGDELIDSYLALARAAHKMGMHCQSYCSTQDIKPLLTKKIRKMGVHNWYLLRHMSLTETKNCRSILNRTPAADFFRRFRSNEGFYELLCVLYGAVELCVGTLTARRQSELAELVAMSCLDRSKRYLIFENRKSGVDEAREKEVRPIPQVIARAVTMLERLQCGLIELGLLKKPSYLFARPDPNGSFLVSGPSSYNRALDSFCDYFEVPLNEHGQRYYIRQHQLRRFFAMLFFWGRSFGGMETLSWFLGHTDVEHLYHYITESTPGAVLRGVKSTFATQKVQEQAEGTEALADLLGKKFGIRQFSVLDRDELEDYIEDLMEEGKLEIEPEFFETPNGKTFRVLIVVKERRE